MGETISVKGDTQTGILPQNTTVRPRRCFSGKCFLTVTLILIVIALAVFIPLIATGVLKVGKQTASVKRISYDPMYYGNLHPYLYPWELDQFGLVAEYDVIVIGAGIAGLTAASTLQDQAGLRVLVLEARPVVGGRLCSVAFGSRSVEIGAQWLSGVQENPLTELATMNEVKLALSESKLDGRIGVASQDSLAIDGELEGPDGVSLGGMDAIASGMAKLFNESYSGTILLNSTVVSIAYEDMNATVTLDNGVTHTAQFVICTVPLGVLQSGGINFSPVLPDDTYTAMYRLGVATINPVHLLFTTPFWNQGLESFSLSGTAAATGWLDFLCMYTFTGEPLLVALPSIERSEALESETDEQVIQSVMSSLRLEYGASAVPAAPLAYLVTRWALNPYARGSHTYYASDSSPADRSTLSEPVSGSLLFAGEAMHTKYPSSLHGAYFSGLDQAQRILAAMEFPQGDEGNATCMADCYGPMDVQVPMSQELNYDDDYN